MKEKGREVVLGRAVIRLPCRTDKATGILMLSMSLFYTLLSLAEDGHGRGSPQNGGFSLKAEVNQKKLTEECQLTTCPWLGSGLFSKADLSNVPL